MLQLQPPLLFYFNESPLLGNFRVSYLCRQLESLRSLLGLEVPEFAALLGISSARYKSCIKRQKSPPLLSFLELSSALGVPMSALASGMMSSLLESAIAKSGRGRRWPARALRRGPAPKRKPALRGKKSR